MKDFIKAIKLTLLLGAFLCVGYVAVLWIFSLCAAPNVGRAEVLKSNGRTVGATHIGQSFTDNRYFWGRPSAVGYDASASAGSNQPPGDSAYLATVNARIDTFMRHHPYLKRSEVPAEMVTASASGLDPDITPQSARVQIRRVAKARGIAPQRIATLVTEHTEKPFLGFLGPPTVNVLQLNIALDHLK